MKRYLQSMLWVALVLNCIGCRSAGPDAQVVTNTDNAYGYHTSGAVEFDIELGAARTKVERVFSPNWTENLRVVIITNQVDAETLLSRNDGTFVVTIETLDNNALKSLGGKLSCWFLHVPSRASTNNELGEQRPVLPTRAWGPPTKLENDDWYEFKAGQKYRIVMEWIPVGTAESHSFSFKPVLLGRPRRYSMW